jgi:hypothetical protein
MNKFIVAAVGLLAAVPAAAAAEQGVLTYHNSNTRHGLYTAPGLTSAAAANLHADPAFKAAFSGNVFAQPLYWKPSGASVPLLIVATESNLILGINANTGATVWQTQLAPSVTSSELPCGDINPEGVTGTPVIDPTTGTLYFDALTETANGPRQMIYGLSASTGQVAAGWPVDVQASLATLGVTFPSITQGERSAILLFNGSIYVDYAARSGDCGTYHGTVVQLQTSSPAIKGYWATRDTGGGIWAQGGAADDGASLYITTGNTFNANNDWMDGEAILRLKPGLAHSAATKDFYTPSNWQTLDNEDADLGGTEALPLQVRSSAGENLSLLIAMGKDGNAYLVNRANLGGIGGQIAIKQVSNNGIITAPAVYNMNGATLVAFTSYSGLSCSGDNITMLSVAGSGTNPMSIQWCSAFNGRGAPIITTAGGSTNPLVWVAGAEGDNEMHGFDAVTGATVFSGAGTSMTGLRHFQTLIAANHHLYVAGDNTVYAFTW